MSHLQVCCIVDIDGCTHLHATIRREFPIGHFGIFLHQSSRNMQLDTYPNFPNPPHLSLETNNNVEQILVD